MKKYPGLLLFLVLSAFVMVEEPAFALSPSLAFSDITSGPKTGLGDGLGSGAIVTVWGNDLGSTQGTSKVYIGDQEVARVYYWGNADGSKTAGPADLYTYQKMQTIAFSVPATAVDGVNTIKVTVNGIDTNTLPFTVRSGRIFHVKTIGSNSNNGSWSSPWRNLDGVFTNGALNGNKMRPGDIVYGHDGLVESPHMVGRDLAGTAANPIAAIAYPGATVIVTGGFGTHMATCTYVHIAKFVIKSDTDGVGMNSHSRVIGNEITDIVCADGQGGAVAGANINIPGLVDGNVVLGNYIHDFGGACTSGLHHVFYITNRGGVPVNGYELGWNYLRDNRARGGLHIYDEGRCGDFNSPINVHDNAVVNQASPGIGASAGLDQVNCISAPINIYNNLLINTGIDPDNKGWQGSAISVGKSGFSSYIKFYNNTIYGWSKPGSGDGAIHIQGSGSAAWVFGGNFEWTNNIVVDTNNLPFEQAGSKAAMVHSNNLWYNGGDGNPASPPSWDAAAKTSNPLFENTAAFDFRLQATSPARNNGIDTFVRYDIKGLLRPVGPSIGAFEFVTNSTPPRVPRLHQP